MEKVDAYVGTRDELLREIEEAKAVVYSSKPLHDDPIEDLAIRGIWSALLEPMLMQLEEMDRVSGVA